MLRVACYTSIEAPRISAQDKRLYSCCHRNASKQKRGVLFSGLNFISIQVGMQATVIFIHTLDA